MKPIFYPTLLALTMAGIVSQAQTNGTMYVTGKEGRKTAVGKLEVKE